MTREYLGDSGRVQDMTKTVCCVSDCKWDHADQSQNVMDVAAQCVQAFSGSAFLLPYPSKMYFQRTCQDVMEGGLYVGFCGSGSLSNVPCSQCTKRGFVCQGPPVGTCQSCLKLCSKCEKSRGQVRKASTVKEKGKEEEVLSECAVYAESCKLILLRMSHLPLEEAAGSSMHC